jgi:ribosomal protein L37E
MGVLSLGKLIKTTKMTCQNCHKRKLEIREGQEAVCPACGYSIDKKYIKEHVKKKRIDRAKAGDVFD